ncbi:hypothetical protein N9X53_03675 [Mariniblastus sp.]|nr:hypothetical protein [Mariniblastus sp.]
MTTESKKCLNDYNQARILKKIVPQRAKPGETFDHIITACSPDWQRRAVVQIHRYWALQYKTLMDMGPTYESWIDPKIEVFPIITEVYDNKVNLDKSLIGFIGLFADDEDPELFCWHILPNTTATPKKLMVTAWNKVNQRFSKFYLNIALSPEFQSFLQLPEVDTSHIVGGIPEPCSLFRH